MRQRGLPTDPECGCVRRRTFLADVGMGFTGLALGAMLGRDARAHEEPLTGEPAGRPHFAPRANRVIWIFCSGGYSHLETFDPKPVLNTLAGKTYNDTGGENPQRSPLFLARSRSVVGFDREQLLADPAITRPVAIAQAHQGEMSGGL